MYFIHIHHQKPHFSDHSFLLSNMREEHTLQTVASDDLHTYIVFSFMFHSWVEVDNVASNMTLFISDV